MKKFASLVGAGAMLLTFASSTFAYDFPCFGPWCNPEPEPEPVVTEATVKNYAVVKNDVVTKADTGDNEVGSWWGKVFGSDIMTGAAEAVSSVKNLVNTNNIGCNCYDDLYVKNKAYVENDVYTKADTGDNKIGGWWTSFSDITTGAANAAGLIENVVNTNAVGGN